MVGTIANIQTSAINAEVFVKLKAGEQIVASLALFELQQLNLSTGSDVLLLINASEIIVTTDPVNYLLSARNQLNDVVIRIQHDGVDSEAVIQLPGGESLAA